MIKDRFSSIVFLVAGIYGLMVLVPGFFGEKMLAEKMPPAITHPEFYYGFFGVAVAWQMAFLIIARDPQRFRPIIPAAILGKSGLLRRLCRASGTEPDSSHCRHGRSRRPHSGNAAYYFIFQAQNGALSSITGDHFADPH